jgi:hypothetical protein
MLNNFYNAETFLRNLTLTLNHFIIFHQSFYYLLSYFTILLRIFNFRQSIRSSTRRRIRSPLPASSIDEPFSGGAAGPSASAGCPPSPSARLLPCLSASAAPAGAGSGEAKGDAADEAGG